MKFLPSQLMFFMQQGTSRRNLRILFQYFGVLAILVVTYSVLFHYIMAYEESLGIDHESERSWVTGFYWTLTVMSTLGFGDITFATDIGRAFSILVLVTGIVFLLILLPFTFIQFFYAPWLEAQARARAPRELPKDLNGHVLLTRYGPVTGTLIERLKRSGYPYAILVPDTEEALRLHDAGLRVVVGDADSLDAYRACRVEHAAMVVTTFNDAANANVALSVRGVTRDVPIVSTANGSTEAEVLRVAGVTHALQLSELTGEALARRTIGGDAMAHVIGELDELLIAEACATRTPLVGKTLKENRLTELGVSVVGVWERGHYEAAGPDTMIGDNTVLVIAGSEEQMQNYNEHFAIYNVSGAPAVIIGGGRVGRAAAASLTKRGVEYRIVEQDSNRPLGGQPVVSGDAADIEILKSAGIMEAPSALVTTHDDNTNIYVTTVIRHLRSDIQIVSRSTLERNVGTLHRAGADFVMSSASMGASLIMNLLKRANILMLAEGVNVVRLPLPQSLAGKCLAETPIRRETGCTVLAVIENGRMQINPDPREPLPGGAELMLIGAVESEDRFRTLYGAK